MQLRHREPKLFLFSLKHSVDPLRVCELIGFCINVPPQLFDFVEAKIAESDVLSIFSQPLRFWSLRVSIPCPGFDPVALPPPSRPQHIARAPVLELRAVADSGGPSLGPWHQEALL